MADERWEGRFRPILAGMDAGKVSIDHAVIRDLVNTYLVRSLDGTALRFSIPVLLSLPLPDAVARSPGYADGAVGVIIDAIKAGTRSVSGLKPIAGTGTLYPGHCLPNIEPVTIISSRAAIGAELWRPDHQNHLSPVGVHLVVRGAVPYVGPPAPQAVREVSGILRNLLDALGETVRRVPASALIAASELSADQKALRKSLPGMGLVAFVGDETRPARSFTQLRCHHRIAGPKPGVNIPFKCPQELNPIEVELSGTGRTVTGLGIRRREVFAVVGSNAQGKSTFLQAVMAGEDDHAAGDGRESLVSIPGAAFVEAGARELNGADVSLFFRSLPPGLGGAPKSVCGQGSGSLVMAHMIEEALRKEAPMLLFDEDRAATNLLVPGCFQTGEVTPLSTLLASRRDVFRDTAVIFAASSLDILIAQADRILIFDRHQAGSISRREFREKLVQYLREVEAEIEGES